MTYRKQSAGELLKRCTLGFLLLSMSVPALAVVTTLTQTDFTGFITNTSVDGQGGWSIGITGPVVTADEEVVIDGVANNVFRMSNAVTSGSVNDMPFAPRLAGIPNYPIDTAINPVLGQPGLFAGESSTTASHRRFYASFQFKSATGAAQPGMRLSVSPDNGAGGRMAYVSLDDTGSGINLVTYDIDSLGNFIGPLTIASGLNYSDWHEIAIEMRFQDGPTNDVVNIYLNGSLIHTGTSWEDYFAAAEPANYPLGVPVQTLVFMAGGGPVPANSGNGFLFDNVLIQVGENVSPVPALSSWGVILLGLATMGLMGWRLRSRSVGGNAA